MLRYAAITPHPPVIVPAIGKNNTALCRKTIAIMEKIGEKLRAVRPETIIVVSPHGPVRFDKFIVNYSPQLSGSLAQFGDNRKFSFVNDRALIDILTLNLKRNHIPIGLVRETQLDYGTLVPMHYLLKSQDNSYQPKLIHIAQSCLGADYHFRFGKIMGEILRTTEESVAFVASAELSHRVTTDAPAGYSPRAVIFDKTVANFVKNRNIEGILEIDPAIAEECGECGFKSIVMLMGTLLKERWEIAHMSYEAPFGVGYLTVNINLK